MNEARVIHKYEKLYSDSFKEMLGIYFNQDCKILLTETQVEELFGEIEQRVNNRIIYLDLLFLDGVAKGFIIYQVDTPQSDWCKKETWGCIREIYVDEDLRGKGYGKKLAAHAEAKLIKLLVPNIYLTADDAIDFWLKMGFRETGEICDNNDSSILMK